MRKVGRFEVMALLQAARYYVLTGDKEKALSFGLNRAIFYAWAKRYAPRGVPLARRERIGAGVEVVKEGDKTIVYVGDEAAYLGPSGYFTIGGREQTPREFMRRVAEKIGAVMPFEEAWKLAVDYVKSFERRVLLSQEKFFERVYKPVRDNFPEGLRRRGQLTLF